VIRAISTFLFGLLVLCVCSAGVQAQFVTRYDYDRPVERVIYAGMQALLTCNGLFVSNRTLDQLYEAELKLDRMPLAPPAQVMVDEKLRAVAVNGSGVVMRAAYRDGLGSRTSNAFRV
jgi:hypothetical protein